MSVRTIALTLKPTEAELAALERLQERFNDACNAISAVAWDHHAAHRSVVELCARPQGSYKPTGFSRECMTPHATAPLVCSYHGMSGRGTLPV